MSSPEETRQPTAKAPQDAGAPGAIASEASGVITAQVMGIGLRYVSSVMVTRTLGATWFGSFALASTVANLLALVSLVGVSPGALPFLARARRTGKAEELRAVVRASWVIVLVVSVLISAAAFAVAPWLGVAVFDDDRFGEVLRPLALFILFTALSAASTGLLQSLLGPRQQAMIDRVLVMAVTTVGLVGTWWFDWGIGGVIVSTIAGPLAGFAVALPLVVRRAPGVLRGSAPCSALPIGNLFRQSSPLMGVNILAFGLVWMDVLLMGVFRSPEEVGIYGASARLAPMVMLVTEAVGPVFMARFAVHFVDRDWPVIRELYRTTGRWSLWGGTVLAAVFFVWGRQVLALFGPEFVAGYSVLVLLALGRAVSATFGMCGRALAVSGKAHLNLVNTTLVIAINGTLDLFWIPRFGAIGAAGATCISVTLVNLLQTGQVWFLYRIHPFTRKSLLGQVAIGVLAVLAWSWSEGPGGAAGWLLPLALFLFACGALYFTWGMEGEDRAFWSRTLRTPRRRSE